MFLILARMSISSGTISDQYLPPIKGEIHPSSLFGDFRPGHFHAGIDIRTGGQTGAELYAASDGYLWRVATTFWGYGRVIYLMTTSGHVITYAHLSRFNPTLASEVYSKQVELSNYKVDLYFKPERFPIKRGDLIGYSGESGPGGPHLHYEVRTPDNRPINPLNGYLSIADNAPPIFSTLAIIRFGDRLDPGSVVKTSQFRCQQISAGRYGLSAEVSIFGRFGIEINAFDKIDGYYGKMGVYRMELFVDKKLIYAYCADTLDFDSFKQANYVRDYKLWWEKINSYKNPSQADGDYHNYYRLFRVPGDRQPTVKAAVADGYFSTNIEDEKDANKILPGKHDAVLKASDIYGNKAELSFVINIAESNQIPPRVKSNSETKGREGKRSQFDLFDGEVAAEITPNKLYYSETFSAIEIHTDRNGSSSILKEFEILPPYTFFKEPVLLKVLLENRSFPANKYCLGKSSGGNYTFCGNNLSDDSSAVSCKIGATGKFALLIDNISPKVTLIFPANGAQIKSKSQLVIRYRMTDNFSGIGREENLKLFLDDKWVPAEYDPDRNLIEFIPPTVLSKGKHTLHLSVSDQCGNKSEHQSIFFII